MKAYAYVAYSGEGRRRTGTVLAETEAHAAEDLRARGLFVAELADRGARDPARARAGGRRGARLTDDLQAVLTRQMAVLLAAGMPVEQALEAVRQGGSGPVEIVAARARAALMEGSPLSAALDDSGAGFAPFYIAALRAGEQAGDPAAVFAELADFLEARGQDRAQIGAALVYPAFVAAVALLVCGILMTSVAPEIVAMFALSDRPLPEITRVVLAISGWIETHLVLIGALLAGLAALWIAAGRVTRLRDARDAALLRLPVVGRLMRHGAAVQYLRTLALVLGSRHAVLSAVSSATGVLTVSRFRRESDAVAEAVRQGETLSSALGRLSFVPPVARQLVTAGEMSARIAPMTERAALLVENGLRVERKRIAALLEPALMMLVGALVLVVILAVLLPIFDLQSVVAG